MNETTNMNKRQKLAIAAMCALAAVLAALMLWPQPAPPAQEGHAAHRDAHGHDDRHEQAGEPEAGAGHNGHNRHDSGAGAVAMSAAQVKANGIAVDSAGPASIRERLHLPAQVRFDAERTVAVAAPAPGILASVPVGPGESVIKGQALAVLRSPAAAQWRAEHAVALQRLALARTTLQREQALWEQGISARQDFEAARAAHGEAAIAVQAARQRLAALGIADSGGAVSSSVTVRAPLAGIVVDKPAVAGQAVDETRQLFTVADLSRVWVEAALPGASLGQVRSGMPLRVSAGALAREVEGTVAYVGPVLGEETRMATVRAVLPNPGLRLRPGMLATIDLLGPAHAAPVTVASEAVQTIHERSVVFVRSAAGFTACEVKLGRSDGRRTEVVEGLAAGTSYAASGAFLLKADLGKGEAGHED